MVAFSVMSYFDRIIMSIAGPEIIREFSMSETEMGAVYTAFLFGYILTMIPGGRWSDRFGPRLVITLTGLGTALFTGITALGGVPPLAHVAGVAGSFIVIRFLMGIATGPLYPSCARVYAAWIPLAGRANVHGYVAGGAGLGGAISPLLFSWLIGVAGWRMSFVWAAAATALLAILWFCYVRDSPKEHPHLVGATMTAVGRPVRGESADTPWSSLFGSRDLMLLTFSYFCVCYFEYIFFFWLYYYLGEVRGLGDRETALATTAVFLAWMIMSPLGGWMSDRLVARRGRRRGRWPVPVGCLLLSGLCLAIGINIDNAIASGALLALSFGLAACSDGPFWAVAVDIGGPCPAAACGVLNAGGNVGGIAPLVTPWIASQIDWSGGLYFAVALLYVGLTAWFFLDPTRAIDRAVPPPCKAERRTPDSSTRTV